MEVLYKVALVLNTTLCQFVQSKTKKAIEFIKEYSILTRAIRDNRPGVHYMTCIVTNNNLEETLQWSHRLKGGTDHMNIQILSSDKDSKFKNIDSLLGTIVRAKNANHLPDMLVMCTHSKRISDITKLLEIFRQKKIDMSSIGVREVNITVMFDEADKNIELICNFFNDTYNSIHIKEDGWYDTVLSNVHLITATPYEEFWEKLKKVNVQTLENINKTIELVDPDNNFILPHEELLREYRTIDDHVYVRHDNDTFEPLEYVMSAMTKILDTTRKHEVMTIYAPAKVEIASHKQMQMYFNTIGFWVLVINGKNKGFYSPNGSFTSMKQVRKELDEYGELYNVLKKWRSSNPEKSIAITGNHCIARGLTFCTTGFSWSDIMVSNYHATSLAMLVQMIGRANGGKEYVNIANIWSPECVMNIIRKTIKNTNKLLKQNPEHFTSNDFVSKFDSDDQAPCKTVPVVIYLTSTEFNSIRKNGKKWDTKSIFDIIRNKDPKTLGDMERLVQKQISKCSAPASYKKHIQDLVSAFEKNQTYAIDIHEDEKKETDLYQIFIDGKNMDKMVISLYYGSKYGKHPE